MRRSSLDLIRLSLLAALGACAPAKADLCEGGESILLANGDASGFERCADGAINRVERMPVDPTISGAACAGDEGVRQCETDADCTDGSFGKCITGEQDGFEGGDTTCSCTYSCATDADCDGTAVCTPPEVTGAEWSTCVEATCLDNDDCASGECGFSAYDDGCGAVYDMMCRHEEDACHADADCGTGDLNCGDGQDWVCATSTCTIGRPLLVDGAARTAPSTARADWAGTLAPETAARLGSLPADTRDTLAAYWAELAALEHASVGSFARFTLQLLALGAPPELLAATQAAAGDEVRHARFAYALASACRGAPVGPSRLALFDAAPGLDARAVIHGLLDEACIGETLGAAEAVAAADACVDPALAAALHAIAADETRHAALAWKALRWLLTDVAPELRDEARAALQAKVARGIPVGAGPHLPAEGVLGPAERARVHHAAMAAVVSPCIRALFGDDERMAAYEA